MILEANHFEPWPHVLECMHDIFQSQFLGDLHSRDMVCWSRWVWRCWSHLWSPSCYPDPQLDPPNFALPASTWWRRSQPHFIIISGFTWEIMGVITTLFFRTRMGVEGSHTPEDPRLHMRPVEAGRKMEWAAYVEELLGECQHMSTVRSWTS